MMTKVEFKYHRYRYMPYELHLAELEVERLLGATPKSVDGSLQVDLPCAVGSRTLERLTYFRDIIVGGQATTTPQQARLEASATKHGDPNQLRRQHTRYSAHGLHEYRGKFNPQMVRVVFNLLGLNAGSKVWDPFCGSGTVLLEARHQGLDAIGVDLNPLAVAIANAKLSAIDTRPGLLRRAADLVAERIHQRTRWIAENAPDEQTISEKMGAGWTQRLPCSEYLVRWFPLAVLAQLLIILDSINEFAPTELREVFRIILSNVVRESSWQDPGDLRIRRRRDPATNYPVSESFISALRAQVNAVSSARQHVPATGGWQSAFLGDSSKPDTLNGTTKKFLDQGVDCVLSSPPYVTALPYIDTQRLSIALLGIATVQEIRDLDSSLVGSREISTKERRVLEESIDDNQLNVAKEVWMLCRDLKDAYDPNSDGFRRQNTPAVVYRYFAGMTRTMSVAKSQLKKGGTLAFIVGPNQTTLGGVRFLIDTPSLLAATGTHVGLEIREKYDLNAYSRYDVHSRNSIRAECLLLMQHT